MITQAVFYWIEERIPEGQNTTAAHQADEHLWMKSPEDAKRSRQPRKKTFFFSANSTKHLCSFSLPFCPPVRLAGALQIENSEETDQGKYECVATNSQGVRYSSPANLYVRGRT